MKIAPNTQTLLAGAAVVVVAAWFLQSRLKEGGQLLVEAAPYVNPLDTRNIVYGGVNAVGGAVAMDENWSLGTWLYDITH